MGIRWGFHWEKAGVGALSLLIFGGITLVVWRFTGTILKETAFIAGCSLITMLSGLTGEEGIW
jgi:hypothetical protein